LLIKKTPEAPRLAPDKMQDDYESLRFYVLSPVKTPSRPLGLDLWNKKGFLAWSAAVFHNVPPTTDVKGAADGHLEAPPALVISIANIMNDWSDKHG